MASGELDGRVAVITGAGTGIGAEIAERFVGQGAKVAIMGRRAEPLEAVAAKLDGGTRTRCLPVSGDVSNAADVQALFTQAAEAFGTVDILVNNAAIAGEVGPIMEVTRAGWDDAIAINLTGPWLCARAAVGYMRPRRWGKIVNIGSISGKRPLANRTPYCATKMGLVGLTRVLAVELGPDNINVNVISPGAVDTPRLAELAEKYQVPLEQIIKASAEKRALQRIPSTGSIADLAVFLSTDHAQDITGFDITVDAGGWFT